MAERWGQLLAGGGALSMVLVIMLLGADASAIVGGNATYVDTDVVGRTKEAVPVQSILAVDGHRLGGGIPGWLVGADQSESGRWPAVVDFYGADSLIVLPFWRSGDYTSIDVFAMSTRQTNVFHSLEASYKHVLGMEMLSLDQVVLPVNRSLGDVPTLMPESLPMSRIVVGRTSDSGAMEERRLAYAFWVVQEDWRTPTHAWWVRAEIVVPPEGPIDAHDARLKDFVADLTGHLFTLPDSRAGSSVAEILLDEGWMGWLLVIASAGIPAATMTAGVVVMRRAGKR